MKQAGVYVIYLTGTSYAYVGESANIGKRWRGHYTSWIWPAAAEFVVVRQMPGSHEKERQRTENALHRLLRRKGYLLLSNPVAESPAQLKRRGRAVAAGLATLTPEERRSRSQAGRAAIEKLTPEQRSAQSRKGWLTRHKNGRGRSTLTAAERTEIIHRAWKTRRMKSPQT